MGWLRCRLSFPLLRCAVMCFRGSRSRRTTALDNVPNLACSAVRVNFAAWVCLLHCFAFIQILSGPLPVFFLSPQYTPISPTCSCVLFCGLLYRLLVVGLSIFLLSMRVSSKFYVLWSLHILSVKLHVSLSFFSFLMRFSSVFIFSVGIFVIFVHC